MIVVERSREPGNLPSVFATGSAPASPAIPVTLPWSTASARRPARTWACRLNPRGYRWTTSTCGLSGSPNWAAASYSARTAGAPAGMRSPMLPAAASAGSRAVAAAAAAIQASRIG